MPEIFFSDPRQNSRFFPNLYRCGIEQLYSLGLFAIIKQFACQFFSLQIFCGRFFFKIYPFSGNRCIKTLFIQPFESSFRPFQFFSLPDGSDQHRQL